MDNFENDQVTQGSSDRTNASAEQSSSTGLLKPPAQLESSAENSFSLESIHADLMKSVAREHENMLKEVSTKIFNSLKPYVEKVDKVETKLASVEEKLDTLLTHVDQVNKVETNMTTVQTKLDNLETHVEKVTEVEHVLISLEGKLDALIEQTEADKALLNVASPVSKSSQLPQCRGEVEHSLNNSRHEQPFRDPNKSKDLNLTPISSPPKIGRHFGDERPRTCSEGQMPHNTVPPRFCSQIDYYPYKSEYWLNEAVKRRSRFAENPSFLMKFKPNELSIGCFLNRLKLYGNRNGLLRIQDITPWIQHTVPNLSQVKLEQLIEKANTGLQDHEVDRFFKRLARFHMDSGDPVPEIAKAKRPDESFESYIRRLFIEVDSIYEFDVDEIKSEAQITIRAYHILANYSSRDIRDRVRSYSALLRLGPYNEKTKLLSLASVIDQATGGFTDLLRVDLIQ